MLRCLLLVCTMLSAVVSAETITLTNGEWPPYLSENYTHNGVASHIVVEAFKLQGVDVKYIFVPWARALKFVQDGSHVGSVVWSYNEERAKDVYFSDPVFKLRTVFFHRKDRSFEWANLEDLKEYQIVATLGYYYGAEFKALEEAHKLKVLRVTTDEQALQVLLAERADLFAAQFEVGYEVLHGKFSSSKAAQITNSKPFDSTDYHLIISKKSPNANELLAKFNEGLAKLRQSGQLDAMLDAAVKGVYRPVLQ